MKREGDLIKYAALAVVLSLLAGLGYVAGSTAIKLLSTAHPKRGVQFADNSQLFEQQSAGILVIGTTTCRWCIAARELLLGAGVEFVDHRLDQSEAARKLYELTGASSVPVIVTPDRTIFGYNEQLILDAITARAIRKQSP